ncbi:cytochrome b/b6 domain-containing protein [Paraburkholderia kururiensis]|uniref:cytochrome b/b6 domain-containing protein n=1 Tax=Paraburkholderia kururiensis TaxID=984307 RepID=UPI0039A69723
MNDTSASRMENESMSPADGTSASGRPAGTVRILVWDAPVRVFHWLMVVSFALAWLTAESERWRLVHVTLGYTMVGLVAFRLIWGLAGTRYARFAAFVRAPGAVVRYLASLVKRHPEPHVGHNPAGAVAIVVMLLLTLAIGATGWAAYNDVGGEAFEELHEGAANAMLALVAIHVAAVLVSSVLHRENLVRSMVTGYKSGRVRDGIRSARWGVAALLIVAVLAWWGSQWQAAPRAGASLTEPAAGAAHRSGQGNDSDHDSD